MEQILKRKKRGRPPKVDPVTRDSPPPERGLRRSLRCRNVRYIFDLDDYFDEDMLFTDDEDQHRREKKLEQLLKLQTGGESESNAPRRSRFRREDQATTTLASSSEDEDKPSKKRRINGYLYQDADDDNDCGSEEDNYNGEEEEEVRERRADPTAEESPPGASTEESSGFLLPDKKALEIILDKLQKKDIYGVYAEPVDPEELPDYHDIIEHPMDFATVRNKLGNGSYTTFKQFESDVFLICSNAMQYNATDTIYYKHAHSIQELAKRKFKKIKLNLKCMVKEIKPIQKSRSGSMLKKQIKRPLGRPPAHEPVGSDFSSGATLATAGDNYTVFNALQQPGIVDGPAEGNAFCNDSNLDKTEESWPGKGQLSQFRRKPFLLDDSRATYTISLSEAVVSMDSIFSSFNGETKQLVPVGLYADHSYARSLAHFAASLGSVAWRVASKRIEEALPQGLKFGQGWVGEYEPLPTPISMLRNCPIKEPPFFAKVQLTANPKKLEKDLTNLIPEKPASLPLSEHRLPFFNPPVSKTPAPVVTVPTGGNNIPETKLPFFLSPETCTNDSPNPSYQHQSFQSRASFESDKEAIPKHVESNGGPLSVPKNSPNHVSSRQIPRSLETEASGSPRNKTFSPPGPFKQPYTYGPTFERAPDRKIANNYRVDENMKIGLSADLSKPVGYYPHQEPGPGFSDPVQLMRQLSEKARQNQQKPLNQSSPNAPRISLPSRNFPGNDLNNAAVAAARAWMCKGSGGYGQPPENANKIHTYSSYNSTGEMASQASRFQAEIHEPRLQHTQENNISIISPVYGFVGQGKMPLMVGGNQMVQFQNQRMVYPQLTGSDLSRLQMQSPAWRGISPQMQPRQKQENFPPDLNIGFQPLGSPGRPSSRVLVDSQQPDLALQL